MSVVKRAFLGYPESDAGVPFAVTIEISQGFLVVLGVFNRGENGFADLESAIMEDRGFERIKANFATEGLIEVPFLEVFWLLEQTKREPQPFPEYELIALAEKNVMAPTFRQGEYDPIRAMNVATLMNPEQGVFFSLPDAIMKDGIKGLVLALKNEKEIQEQIIEAVVDSCAELSLEDPYRARWSLALDALSCMYQSQGNHELAQIAQDNRRAIDLGALGSQVPFVRNWAKQQLLNAVAMAQLMAREE